jgi:excinuclease ABC subunit A
MAKPDPAPAIRLRGVRHNNLKNFDLDLPLGQLIVITGLSGSGKSSLAFDTLFAEGQRRYIETFSPYARQFFDRMDKPRVDKIEGIPPAIAIEQRNSVKTTRSTVGTMTELCDYLKLLWPHLAQLHCRGCGNPVRKEPPQAVWEAMNAGCGPRTAESTAAQPQAPEVVITFDLPLSDKLSLHESLALISKQGYQRLLVDGEIVRVEEAQARIQHPATSIPRLTVLQDRVRLAPARRARFVEACEQAYHFGKGKLAIREIRPPSALLEPRPFSAGLHCAQCDIDYREPTPALFSFNHPVGACPTCKGFGRVISIDYQLAVPDRSKTLRQGVVRPWQSGFSAECQDDLMKFCRARRIATDVPFSELSKEHQDWILNGEPDYGIDDAHEWPHAWYGVKGYFKWLESKAYKMHVRVLLSRYRAYSTCPDCQGQRFQPDALLYLVSVGADVTGLQRKGRSEPPHVGSCNRLTLADFYALPLDAALALIDALAAQRPFKPTDPLALLLAEVRSRLGFLVEVGLGYLTLDRPMRTLSGGETERVSLTACLGTRLVNTLYVLDEPSVGLHARDTARLVRILERLRDLGNTVVVVEHEAGVIRAADQIVDLGPGSGEAGGQLVFQGTFEELRRCTVSLTGQYLGGRRSIDVAQRRPVGLGQTSLASRRSERASRVDEPWVLNDATLPYESQRAIFPALKITGATRHNLNSLTVEIPLNRLVCLTGVSGSGKTTLVREVLLPALEAKFQSQARFDRKASERFDREDSPGAETEPDTPTGVALAGHEHLGRAMLVDQSPIGKTPRSNPVVYIGAFDAIRDLFAKTELAIQRSLNSSAFSFNSGQGQCERCRGAGFEKIEMQFLSDVFIRCPDCDGRRYRAHILEVKLPVSSPQHRTRVRALPKAEGRGEGEASGRAFSAKRHAGASGDIAARNTDHWSIADFLDATADDALTALAPYADTPAGRRALGGLALLQEVGLGYLRLGQPINTLSGGECQRLKLVSHLAEAAAAADPGRLTSNSGREAGLQVAAAVKPTMFLFDEPTTGLHFEDVRVLLRVFQRLVDAGHSVLVIEHNLDVIRSADWVIDLGPEAGARGGEIVIAGTPEEIAACPASHTGSFLRDLLASNRVQR